MCTTAGLLILQSLNSYWWTVKMRPWDGRERASVLRCHQSIMRPLTIVMTMKRNRRAPRHARGPVVIQSGSTKSELRTFSLRALHPAGCIVCTRRVGHLFSTQVFLNKMTDLRLLNPFSVWQHWRIDRRLPLYRLPEQTRYFYPRRLRYLQLCPPRHRARVCYSCALYP